MREPYIIRVFNRAKQMTKEDIGFVSPKNTILHITLGLITLLVIYYSSGLNEALSGANDWLIATVAIIGWAGLIFCWNIIFAPSSLQNEADDKINLLTKILDRRATWQQKLDKLWELRSEGISLRNTKKLIGDEFNEWINKINSWRERTEASAFELDPNLKHWIHHLDTTVDNPLGRPKLHEANSYTVGGEIDIEIQGRLIEWDRQVRMVSTVLDRLARYLLKEFDSPKRFDE